MYVGDCFWWEYDKLASWKFVCQTCSKHQTSKIVQRTGVWSLNQKVDWLLVLFFVVNVKTRLVRWRRSKRTIATRHAMFWMPTFTVYIYIYTHIQLLNELWGLLIDKWWQMVDEHVWRIYPFMSLFFKWKTTTSNCYVHNLPGPAWISQIPSGPNMWLERPFWRPKK